MYTIQRDWDAKMQFQSGKRTWAVHVDYSLMFVVVCLIWGYLGLVQNIPTSFMVTVPLFGRQCRLRSWRSRSIWADSWMGLQHILSITAWWYFSSFFRCLHLIFSCVSFFPNGQMVLKHIETRWIWIQLHPRSVRTWPLRDEVRRRRSSCRECRTAWASGWC